MRRRRSHRRNQPTPQQNESIVDRVLDAASEDPEGFVEASARLGRGVVEGVRMVGEVVRQDPDGVQRLIRKEGVRLVAKLVKAERRR